MLEGPEEEQPSNLKAEWERPCAIRMSNSVKTILTYRSVQKRAILAPLPSPNLWQCVGNNFEEACGSREEKTRVEESEARLVPLRASSCDTVCAKIFSVKF